MQDVLNYIEDKTGWVGTIELGGVNEKGEMRVKRFVILRPFLRRSQSHNYGPASALEPIAMAMTSSHIMPS